MFKKCQASSKLLIITARMTIPRFFFFISSLPFSLSISPSEPHCFNNLLQPHQLRKTNDTWFRHLLEYLVGVKKQLYLKIRPKVNGKIALPNPQQVVQLGTSYTSIQWGKGGSSGMHAGNRGGGRTSLVLWIPLIHCDYIS